MAIKKIEPKIRNARFVEHIEKHLKDFPQTFGANAKVMCKICGKTIDEIAQESES